MRRGGSMQRKIRLTSVGMVLALAVMLFAGVAGAANPPSNQGKWVSGDLHHHTTLSDGSHTMPAVMKSAADYGLDWWANVEHGGAFSRDALGNFFDQLYSPPQFLGDPQPRLLHNHKSLWRWQSLLHYSFPVLLAQRQLYHGKLIVQGLEWSVPAHEHCSVGIIAPDAFPIAQFEYLFDQYDVDTSNGGGLYDFDPQRRKVLENHHAKAVAAVQWLQQHHGKAAWMVFVHPERRNRYKISDFRDFNNAGPDVAFGFDGLPGHQKAEHRGGYGGKYDTAGGGTYGGAGLFTAQVGGLWDALLGEGRHWWVFVSSDFHDTPNDFWPGQYAKTWTYVPEVQPDGRVTYAALVNALRAGNSFCVTGDLINTLDFRAAAGQDAAAMGQELQAPPTSQTAAGPWIALTIRFKSPAVNHHGDRPVVDHIDLIAGEVRGKAQPGMPAYDHAANDSTRVIATFTARDWETDAHGCQVVRYHLIVQQDMYFRLRGTNLPANTPGETDAQGNPLLDAVPNSEAAAWRDLWFYSNPIFVNVGNKP